MFTGSSPALQQILSGILAAAAAVYVAAAMAMIAAIRAEPARAVSYARLAGVVKVGPVLVGLACMGFVISAIDFRPEHETDLFAKWPALLPQVALLSAGAGFLTGLLAGARPVWVGLACGGPMAALSSLVFGVTGWFLVSVWREGAAAEPEMQQAVPPVVRDYFKYLALFPIVAIAVAAASAGVGRWLHALLNLPGHETQAGRVSAPRPLEPAAPPTPALPVPASSGATSPPPAAFAPDMSPAGRLPPLALPRPGRWSTRWPSLLLMALGLLMLIPAGCDVLTPKARLSASDPAGGAMLSGPPSDVTLTFSDELSPSSKLTVRRTVTLDEAGQLLYTGGTPVAGASGSSALSVDRRRLRVRLPDALPGGLYLVEWTTLRASGNYTRYGDLYFGVRMKVPRSIRDGGVSRETDPHARDRRALLGGGVLAILLGFAWRRYVNALQGR